MTYSNNVALNEITEIVSQLAEPGAIAGYSVLLISEFDFDEVRRRLNE